MKYSGRVLKGVLVLAVALFSSILVSAQKGKAGANYYPLGYTGNIWTGKVTAVDNEQRTLTLTAKGKNGETFIAVIPDAPYEWIVKGVIDFPFDKKTKNQVYKYETFADSDAPGMISPSDVATGMKTRPNPPDTNRINDFSEFLGREVTVYYTSRERSVDGKKVKYNDVWRIRLLA